MRTKVLKCRDFGMNCEMEFRGQTVEAVLDQAKKHGVETHGLTPEQASSATLMEVAASKVRDDDGS